METLPEDIEFTTEEVEEYKAEFAKYDADGNGHVTTEELAALFKSVGESVPGYKLRDMIAEVDTNRSGTIEWDEFLYMMKKSKAEGGKVVSAFGKAIRKMERVETQGGWSEASSTGTTHSFAEDECFAFSDWINSVLADDKDVKGVVPIDVGNKDALFRAVKSGVLICKLINKSVPETIDERAINKSGLNSFLIAENHTLALKSAQAIGCNIVNIGPRDLSSGVGHLILGILWQIIRIGLISNISLKPSTNDGGKGMAAIMASMMEPGEDAASVAALSPDAMLIRWVNYHLKNSGTDRRIENFSSDIQDGVVYTYLLKEICPSEVDGVDLRGLSSPDESTRAEICLENADKMGCRKFVRAQDIVSGNAKLNMAFVANLFNTHPGFEKALANGADGSDLSDLADSQRREETREEKTFRAWINSLGANPFVYNLYTDLCDGIILLQLFDKVQPGIVDWDKKVNNPPFKKLRANFLKLENCAYACELGKQMNFSMVGIGGKDIFDGNEKLIQAIIWQLMRAYTISVLKKLSGSDAPIEDADIVAWANNSLEKARKAPRITSFKDETISNSLAILELVEFIKPKSLKRSVITKGETEAEKMSNAKYAISMCRKIGASVYVLPEDIVEVNQKMVLTVFACLMARSLVDMSG